MSLAPSRSTQNRLEFASWLLWEMCEAGKSVELRWRSLAVLLMMVHVGLMGERPCRPQVNIRDDMLQNSRVIICDDKIGQV